MRAFVLSHIFAQARKELYPTTHCYAASWNRKVSTCSKKIYNAVGKGVYALPEFLRKTG